MGSFHQSFMVNQSVLTCVMREKSISNSAVKTSEFTYTQVFRAPRPGPRQQWLNQARWPNSKRVPPRGTKESDQQQVTKNHMYVPFLLNCKRSEREMGGSSVFGGVGPEMKYK